ncbi:hypothetical protein SAMN05443246_4159 [Paenibacillus sp. GP183]|jgi:hypothetical protein|nr:hypothetical protein SAMN05443246_4159 [Paenibacillus sp. GP183]
MIELTDPLPKLENQSVLNRKICSMEIYQFDCQFTEKRIRDLSNCHCGLFKISSNGISGWGEYRVKDEHFDFVRWASVFMHIKGLTISDAIHFVQNHNESLGTIRTELASSALQDLIHHLQNPNTNAPQHINISLERSFLFDQSQSYFSF